MFAKSLHLALMLLFAFPVLTRAETPVPMKQVVLGAGPSTEVVRIFFEKFTQNPGCKGYEFEVPTFSSKHAGGIKGSDHMLFGRTGRRLNEKERELGKEEIILAKVPLVFVVHNTLGITQLSLEQLKNIFLGSIDNWKQFKGLDAPIIVLGRENTESLFTMLKEEHPFFNESKFSMVFQRDHDMVIAFKKPIGRYAIGFGALPNFSNDADAALLKVEGVETGVWIGLVYDKKNADHPLVRAAREFADSPEWVETIKAEGYGPPATSTQDKTTN